MDKNINIKLGSPHERLRFLRSLTRLTRKEISEKYDLPFITLNKWETGSLPLSNKGVIKCINIYKSEGIITTEDWIKFGKGFFPYIFDSTNQIAHKAEHTNFENDINFFKKTYLDSIVHIVEGDEMLPVYKEGDIIIGCEYKHDYKNLHNKICLINIENNDRILLRKLCVLDNKRYNLYCTNPITNTIEPILYNVQIQKIAPVIWHGIIDKN